MAGGIVFQHALQAGGIVERISIPKIFQLSGSSSSFVIPARKMKEHGMNHPIPFLVRKELQPLFIKWNGNFGPMLPLLLFLCIAADKNEIP